MFHLETTSTDLGVVPASTAFALSLSLGRRGLEGILDPGLLLLVNHPSKLDTMFFSSFLLFVNHPVLCVFIHSFIHAVMRS